MSEDFSIATAAEGDNSTRAVKSLAVKGGLGQQIKAARSAWSYFQSHFFAQAHATEAENDSSSGGGEKLKLADSAAAWKRLTDEEKKPFEALAAKDRARHEQENVARDEQVRQEQEERRARANDISARERPKYISSQQIDKRARAMARKKDPKEEDRRLTQMEADLESGALQMDSIESKADRHALTLRKERRARLVLQREAERQMDEQMKIQRVKRAARLRHLLQQSDVFAHFMNKSQGKPIVPPSPHGKGGGGSSLSTPLSPSKRHAESSAVAKKRKTEAEEDSLLLQQAEAEGQVNVRLTVQPSYVKGGEMRDYQLEGLNWMIGLNTNGMNGILADEMGLGKTLQSISILAYMSEFRGIDGPHIVVVPKSTLPNWMNEFKRWCPSLRALKLHGTKEEREVILKSQLVAGLRDEDRTWDVLITSYEMCILCANTLKKLPWNYLVLDEAHRVKNENSKLSKVLRTFSVRFRLLLTGTPLQNNLHELWALLNFLLPEVFHSSEDFDEWFDLAGTDDDDAKRKLVGQLHKILKPFMLRRLKADVAKSIPPKTEMLLYTGLSKMQQQLYKKTLMREMSTLQRGDVKSKSKLCNIVMQLRKATNHPYLFTGVEDRSLDPMGDHLITNCGKLVLLDKLLPKLKAQGSRVLLFSQMTRLLDILEDYCYIRGHAYCRIDGQTDYETRATAIDAYNEPNSKLFMFLLSTRAGGLGINLATADTVILYDSDWNPQVDLQAQDRAHRIGQTKPVHVYRLVTENTVEEKIIERAEMKLRLDAVIVQQGRIQQQTAGASKDDMLAAIRYGADKVFKSNDGTVTDDDIDAIIARGKAKTDELSASLQEKCTGDNLDFKLEYSSSIQEFDGVDYADLRAREAEKKRQENLKFALSMSDAIGKRERKQGVTYNADAYYREQDRQYHDDDETGRKPRIRIPKPRRLPRMEPWQFYNRKRLIELFEIEEGRFIELVKTANASNTEGPLQLLTEEEEQEREQLLQEGFKSWTNACHRRFVHAMREDGRNDFTSITKKLESFNKTEDEVRAYSTAFWTRGPTAFPPEVWEKYVSQIESGEAKLEEMTKLLEVAKKKVSSTREKGPFEFDRMQFLEKARNKWTTAEDAYLLCAMTDYGYGKWREIRAMIRAEPRFRFDYFFLSRREKHLKSRCDTLIRNVVKEEEEIQKRAQKEAEAEEKRRKRETEQLEKIRLRREVIEKRQQQKVAAREAREKAKSASKRERAEERMRLRAERRSKRESMSAEKRAALRAARRAAKLMSPSEKQIAATVIDQGLDCGMGELVNAIAEKVPPNRTKIVITAFVRRVAEKQKAEGGEKGTKKVWRLVKRARLLKTDAWVKRQNELKVSAVPFISIKSHPVKEEDVPTLLRVVQYFGDHSLDDLIDEVEEHLMHTSESSIKQKIKELCVKDKRLGQTSKRWNVHPQSIPLMEGGPKTKDDLVALKAKVEVQKLDYEEAEADAEDDDSSDDESSGEESSDDEETFISKHGPTKPKTAFARFCHATKHKLPDEFKSLTGRDLRQHLSQLWKAADIQTKKPFEESLAADRIEYEAAMKKFKQGPFAEWKKTHPSSTSEESSSSDEDSSEDEAPKRKKRKTKVLTPLRQFIKANAPKKCPSSYFVFSESKRKEFAAMGENQPKGKHLMMAIGALWKQLTPEDKRPFEEMAAALKLAKQEEMDAFKLKLAQFKKENPLASKRPKPESSSASSSDATETDGSSSEEEVAPTKRKKKKLNPIEAFRKKNQPKKSPPAYLLFSMEHRMPLKAKHPELKQKDLLKIIGAMWQKTSKEERAPFEEKAKERKAQYQKDMAAFEAGPLAEFMKLQASKEEQSM